MGARKRLAEEPLIPFNIKKWTFCLIDFPSSINDDNNRGCKITPSSIAASRFKYITIASGRILFSSVVYGIGFSSKHSWFESCSNHVTSPLVPKITQKVYISYRVFGFQSCVNLAVSHITKWLSSALVWQ